MGKLLAKSRRVARAAWVGALVTAMAVCLGAGRVDAQDRRQNTPGQFDYYVLSLSWSPSFCAEARERNPDRVPRQQCSERPYSFVVHGLWPQYERGFPNYCQQPSPRVDRNIMTSMLDIMPAPGLIFSEWEKHGTCSGLSPRGYFEAVRKARAAVKIPDAYLEPEQAITVSPDEVEEAFVRANPSLPRNGVAVICGGARLSEVRVCLTKDMRFRDCEEIDRRACRRDRLSMPPARGGGRVN